jgi:hypothetical protein
MKFNKPVEDYIFHGFTVKVRTPESMLLELATNFLRKPKDLINAFVQAKGAI